VILLTVRLLMSIGLTSLFMLMFPALNFLTSVLWGVSLMVAGLYLNQRLLLLIFLADAVSFMVFASDYLLFPLVSVGLPVFLMSIMAARRKTYYLIRQGGLFSCVVAVTVMLGLLFYSAGQADVSLADQASLEITRSVEQYLDSGQLSGYLNQGVTREELLAAADTFSRLAVLYLPAVKYIQALVSVFIVLSIAAGHARRRKLEVLQKQAYPLERMPWPFSWLVILGMAVWVWNYQGTGYWGGNLLAVMAVVSIYFGNAVLLFYYHAFSGSKRTWLTLAIFLAAFLLPQAVLLFVMFLGVFDSLLDYRHISSS
jgi:hypothetical protein